MSDVLAAISMLSLNEGHRAVLSAMSDYSVVCDEAFRFENLITYLRLPDPDSEDGTTLDEDEGVWEARTATITLINALTNRPDSLEERIMLRDEFGRRGLNEAIVVSSTSNQPWL